MSQVFQEQLARLPDLLGAHIVLTLIALAAGLAVAMPAAFAALRFRGLQAPLLAVASVIQTVPSLALLALMVAAFGLFGQPAALIALACYSMLPILRNTITGIEGVDPAVVEAARGIGMTESQVLWRVQLPLAAPVIIAGVRTATVWVVGIATLATPVGADSLGTYIFSGLQTRNPTAVLFGVAAAAVLAIALDLLIHLGEIATSKRSRPLGATAAAGLGFILLIGLWPTLGAGGPAAVTGQGQAARPQLVIGAKAFTEQFILARVLQKRLADAGYDATLTEGLGSSVVFDALVEGDVDIYVDYSGTIWANHMKREDVPAPAVVLDEMKRWLAAEHRITSLGALGFENTYALATRSDTAERLGLVSIEDLAAHAPALELGSDYEFFDRPEWARLRDTYDLRFAAQRTFDPTLMYPAVVDGDVDAITAFSTDGRIAAFDLRVLEDPRRAFPPYDAVLLLGPEAARDQRVVDALEPLIGAIDAAVMRQANKLVDVDKRSLDQAAGLLLDAASRAAAE